MTIWDDRLLEILQVEGPSSPTPLSDHNHIHVNKSTVSRRLRRLSDHGLVQHFGNGVYSITIKGEEYLNCNLDAAELSEETEDEGEAST